MALEKFIIGKKDNAHHDGKAANQRRLAEADCLLEDGIEELSEQGIIFDGRLGKKRRSLLYQRWQGEIESGEA